MQHINTIKFMCDFFFPFAWAYISSTAYDYFILFAEYSLNEFNGNLSHRNKRQIFIELGLNVKKKEEKKKWECLKWMKIWTWSMHTIAAKRKHIISDVLSIFLSIFFSLPFFYFVWHFFSFCIQRNAIKYTKSFQFFSFAYGPMCLVRAQKHFCWLGVIEKWTYFAGFVWFLRIWPQEQDLILQFESL